MRSWRSYGKIEDCKQSKFQLNKKPLRPNISSFGYGRVGVLRSTVKDFDKLKFQFSLSCSILFRSPNDQSSAACSLLITLLLMGLRNISFPPLPSICSYPLAVVFDSVHEFPSSSSLGLPGLFKCHADNLSADQMDWRLWERGWNSLSLPVHSRTRVFTLEQVVPSSSSPVDSSQAP